METISWAIRRAAPRAVILTVVVVALLQSHGIASRWARAESGGVPSPQAVREACKVDVQKFCAQAGNPLAIRSCILQNAKLVQPTCRAALQAAGMIAK